MSGHLGETAAALADGALGADARDRALAHLAGCEDCRADVDMQRRLKGLLVGLGEPSMSPLMFNRLLDIGDQFPGDRHDGSGDGGLASWQSRTPFGQPVFRGQDPGRPLAANFASGFVAAADSYAAVAAPAAAAGTLPWLRALRTTVVGGLAVGAMVVTAAVVLAGGTGGGDPIQPSLGDLSVEHAQTTRDLPGSDPVLGAVVSLSAQR